MEATGWGQGGADENLRARGRLGYLIGFTFKRLIWFLRGEESGVGGQRGDGKTSEETTATVQVSKDGNSACGGGCSGDGENV